MKASVFIATSLDGFIARANGALDWLPPDDDAEPHGFDEFMASVDALVMGRHTFQTVLSFGSWPYGSKPVIVLTSRPDSIVAPVGSVCEAMSGSPHEIVARLAARGFTHLYIDGGITVQRFLDAGLIQQIIVTRIPVLLGTGIPLFGPVSRDIRFEHVATRAFQSGLVQSEYRLVK